MAKTETVVLKLTRGGETHRMKVALQAAAGQTPPRDDVLTYERLLARVREVFPRLTGAWTLVYRDDEGDVVTLSHALEFHEACHVLLQMDAAGKRSLHFYVVSRVSLREKVVAPVLHKVAALARLAGEATVQLRHSELLGRSRDSIARLAGGAVAHVRNSELLSRGRESLGSGAVHTRSMLLSARSGVSTRLRHASSAVAAGMDRRRRSSPTSSPPSSSSDDAALSPRELPKTPSPCSTRAAPSTAFVSPLSPMEATEALASVETVVMRQTETVTSVAESETARQSSVQVTQNEQEQHNTPALAPAASRETQPRSQDDGAQTQGETDAQEAADESDADTLGTTSCDEEDDREWDLVDDPHADAIAETDAQWTRELSVLRGVLEHVDEELCCDLLAQHAGNVEAVLVALTDM